MNDANKKRNEKEECYICGKLCAPKMLKHHIRNHTDLTLYDCEECGGRFANKKILKKHLTLHQIYHYCEDCNKKYKSEDKFKNHICTTEKIKDRVCETCGKAFFSKHDLDRHIRSHTNDRPFLCSICNKGFTQKSNRDVHFQTHNKNRVPVVREKKYVCGVCFQAFGYKQHLNRHRYVHTGEKPYVCNICERGFTQSTHLKLHIQTHSTEKRFQCEKCNKMFKRKTSLVRHNAMHEGLQIMCSYCEKGFFSKAEYDTHMMAHTNTRPYTCDICYKTFPKAKSLELHYNSHINKTKKVLCQNKEVLLNNIKTENTDQSDAEMCDYSEFIKMKALGQNKDLLLNSIKTENTEVLNTEMYDSNSEIELTDC